MTDMLTRALAALLLGAAMPAVAAADVWPVAAGGSIQAAIDQAVGGDLVALDAGSYPGDVDFAGKAITVLGLGPDTVLEGTGGGPVVRFDSNEGPGSVLDSVVVTGGLAERGGGIYIAGASPTVVRTIVFGNRARFQGSGIYVTGSSASIRNNLLLYNGTAAGDPHTIEVQSAAPAIVNNTIVRNDSNAVITRGSSAAIILNNVLAWNGSRGRGRGICDFSGGVARIGYNLFYRNRKAALLTDGIDFRKIGRAESRIGPPRLEGNVDGNPRFEMRSGPPRPGSRRQERTTLADFAAGLQPRCDGRRQRTYDAGHPDPAYDDLDGTRNDIGFTGGPDAPTW